MYTFLFFIYFKTFVLIEYIANLYILFKDYYIIFFNLKITFSLETLLPSYFLSILVITLASLFYLLFYIRYKFLAFF